MWSWLTNPWVIGIGGGIISGALVTWIANIFITKKENREYVQKLVSANNEVIYAIRPGISEGQIPTREIIADLISATARRYCVSSSDLYGYEELVQELVKQVMDSSFLSAAKKSEYCDQLTPLRMPVHPPEPESKDTEFQLKFSERLHRERKQEAYRISTLLGLITAIGSILFSFRSLGVPGDWLTSERVLRSVAEVLGGMAAVGGLAVVFYVLRQATRRREMKRFNATLEEEMQRLRETLKKGE